MIAMKLESRAELGHQITSTAKEYQLMGKTSTIHMVVGAHRVCQQCGLQSFSLYGITVSFKGLEISATDFSD